MCSCRAARILALFPRTASHLGNPQQDLGMTAKNWLKGGVPSTLFTGFQWLITILIEVRIEQMMIATSTLLTASNLFASRAAYLLLINQVQSDPLLCR